MNCQKFHQLYEQYLFDALDEAVSGEVEEHLGYCEHCQEWHQGQQAIGDALRLSACANLPTEAYFEGLMQRTAPSLRRPALAGGIPAAAALALRKFIDSRSSSFRLARASAICAVSLGIGIALGPGLLNALDRGLAGFLPKNPHVMSAKAIERAASDFYTSPLSGGPGGLRSDILSQASAGAGAMSHAVLSAPLFAPSNGKPNAEAMKALFSMSLPGAEAGIGTIKNRIDEYLNRWSEPVDPGNPSAEIQSLLCREARAALAGGDYMLCQTKYLEAYNTRPESRFGCRALFELGSLHFDIKRNFPAAHEFYSKCLEYNPAYLNRASAAILNERAELLSQYAEDGYAPLNLYYLASDMKASEAAPRYLELLAKYPTCPLIEPAIEKLAQAAADPNTRNFPGDEVLRTLRDVVREQPRTRLAAKAQIAVADIERDHNRNYYRATQEYRKVLNMRSAGSRLKSRAQEQIDQNRWRAGAPTGGN